MFYTSKFIKVYLLSMKKIHDYPWPTLWFFQRIILKMHDKVYFLTCKKNLWQKIANGTGRNMNWFNACTEIKLGSLHLCFCWNVIYLTICLWTVMWVLQEEFMILWRHSPANIIILCCWKFINCIAIRGRITEHGTWLHCTYVVGSLLHGHKLY